MQQIRLIRPAILLGGTRAVTLLATAEGRTQFLDMLGRIEAGTCA